MPLLPHLYSLWRNLFRKAKKEWELTDEIDAYLELLIEQKLEEGLAPAEARRAALIELGGRQQLKERVREVRAGHLLEILWQDLRYASRMLLRSPGFTAVVVLILALGIGANTAIFSLINVAMLKSLPVDRPDELIMLTTNARGISKNQFSFSQALWEQFRDRQDLFSAVSIYGLTGVDLSAGGEVRPAGVGLVGGDFFSLLGVRPALGRILGVSDDQPGCSAVAVITHAFWRSEYGGSVEVLGKTVVIGGQPFQIVGVAEPRFF